MALDLTVTVSDARHPNEPDDHGKLFIHLVLPEQNLSENEMLKFDQIRRTVSVAEDLAVGSYIYTVNVKPLPIHLAKNRRIVYSLSEGHRLFTVHPITGVITTISSLRGTGNSTVTITANQQNTQASSSVSIMVDEIPLIIRSAPKFAIDSLVYNIYENIPIGSAIGEQLVPVTGGNVSYKIMGRDSSHFKLDDEGILRSAMVFDRESNPHLGAFIYVTSNLSGQHSVIPITVNLLDQNDVEPLFPQKSYAATVMENIPINSFIIKAEAEDADNSSLLEYSLMMNSESSALSSLLTVDRNGVIRNAEPLLGLDGKYQFAIIARDGYHSGTSATIFMTILPTSKCQPSFSEPTENIFYLKENEEPPKELAHFIGSVSSEDCHLIYAIWDGFQYVNSTEFFEIDPETGILTSKVAFDYEEKNKYSLIVAAQSNDLFSQILIEIRIIDIDDNSIEMLNRELYLNIREDEALGRIITEIQAVDEDTSDKIYYHMTGGDGKFTIGLESGVLTLAKPLDREEKESYVLNVIASNFENYSTQDSKSDFATIYINVLDVNDNGPIFEKDIYMSAISSHLLAGAKIMTVSASDPDVTTNSSPDVKSRIVYRIDNTYYRYMGKVRQADGFIIINENSGEIILGKSPKEFTGGLFEGRIATSDISDIQSHISTSKIKIWIYDESNIVQVYINENPKNLDVAQLEELMRQLSELCACRILPIDAKYVKTDGYVQRDALWLQLIFINTTTDVILLAENAISLIDKNILTPTSSIPKLSSLEVLQNSAKIIKESTLPTSRFRETALLLLVFASILITVLIIFGFILSYHRSKFLREKKAYEEEKIALGTLNKINRFKQPSSYIKPRSHNLREKYPNSNSSSIYGVQEVHMIVDTSDMPSKKRAC